MLIIKDLNKLKIKRIHGTKIYFNYDKEEYFIKDISDEYSDDGFYTETYLFKRVLDKRFNGYKLEFITKALDDGSEAYLIFDIIDDISQKAYPFKHICNHRGESNINYKFIDKLKLVQILEEYQLVKLQLEK